MSEKCATIEKILKVYVFMNRAASAVNRSVKGARSMHGAEINSMQLLGGEGSPN